MIEFSIQFNVKFVYLICEVSLFFEKSQFKLSIAAIFAFKFPADPSIEFVCKQKTFVYSSFFNALNNSTKVKHYFLNIFFFSHLTVSHADIQLF